MVAKVQYTKSGKIALIVDNTEVGIRAIVAVQQVMLSASLTGVLNIPTLSSGGSSSDVDRLSKEVSEIKLMLAEFTSRPSRSIREEKEDELSRMDIKEVRRCANKWARACMKLSQCHPSIPWKKATATLEKETQFNISEHRGDSKRKRDIDIIQENSLLPKYAAILFELSDQIVA